MTRGHPSRAIPETCLRWLACVALWLPLVLAMPALASPRNPAPDWAQAAAQVPLAPHLSYFKEMPGQALDWRQAAGSDLWRAADPAGMAALHGHATQWMRVEVTNSSDSIRTRWVVIDYWAMENARLFVLDSERSRLLGQYRSGQALAPADRALDTEQAAFAVTLMPGQRAHLLLRVSGAYWSHMEVSAWEPSAYFRARDAGHSRFAFALGGALALLVVLLLHRDRTLALVALWMSLSLALELTYSGLVSEFVVPARVLSPVMLLLMLGGMTNVASAFVIMALQGLDRHRFWSRWNWLLLVLVSVLTALALMLPAYGARQGLSLLNVLQVVSNVAMLAAAKVRGNRIRQLLAMLMLANFAVAIGRVVVRQYYVEPSTFESIANAAMSIKGSLVLMVILLAILQYRRRLHEAQQRLRQAEQAQREVLQTTVEQRTSELKQALADATEANLVKSKFLGRVSHDLRSPLTSIIGYSQRLVGAGGAGALEAKVILRSGRRMLELVNDLIDYATGSVCERIVAAPMYIHALLDAVAQEARMLAQRRGNEFVLLLDDSLPTVLIGDSLRIRRILMNLLDNAAKYTDHGVVTLRARVRADPQDEEVLHVSFEVRDSGIGIPLAEQNKVFEPFERLKATDTEGSGLGLPIVQALAHAMGGIVRLSSREGEGTCVQVELPLRIGSEVGMSEREILDAPAELPSLNGEGHRVLVVEDIEEIRRLLTSVLEDAGFVVESAESGGALLERIGCPGIAPPSLVLTDYQMPGADGAAVLAAVRQRWPGVPVVLLSATRQSMESFGQPSAPGFAAVLAKPIDLAELWRTLGRILGLQGHDTPPELRDRLRELVALGAISDLRDWAEELAAQPRHRAFAGRLRALAGASDLEGLVRLAAEEALPTGGA